ncbi:hypothetical protein R3P38DRAFT_3046896 [Favolaschia claudopus]|uniref:Uncharacterized protein n=1 Tax=Favolaschia claudopus TaxID=2862362 RepID=A0AAW0A714_9AGAR
MSQLIAGPASATRSKAGTCTAGSASKKRRRSGDSPSVSQSSGQQKRHRGADEALDRSSEKPTSTPHPCTFPTPKRPGITCLTHLFLVDKLPENYPYLPFQADLGTLVQTKHQIPFYCFSGPDPPPNDVGASLGDLYIASDACILYAYLGSNENLAQEGVWKRWDAVTGTPNVDALLKHPHFPDRYLWTINGFTWAPLDAVTRYCLGSSPGVINDPAYTKWVVEHTIKATEKQNQEYLDLVAKTVKPSKTQAEHGVVRELIASLDKERHAHGTQLAALHSSLRTEKGTVARLENANSTLQASLAQYSEAASRFQVDKAASSKTINNLRQENNDLKVAQTQLTASLDEKLARLASVDAERVSLASTNEDTARKNEVLKKLLEERAAANRRLNTEYKELLKRHEDLLIKYDNAAELVDEKTADMARVESEKAALAQQNEAMKATLAKQQQVTASGVLADASQSIPASGNFDREREAWAAKLQAAESTIDGLRGTAKVLLAELDRSENAAKAQAADQQKKIMTLGEEVARLRRERQ